MALSFSSHEHENGARRGTSPKPSACLAGDEGAAQDNEAAAGPEEAGRSPEAAPGLASTRTAQLASLAEQADLRYCPRF